MGLFGSRLIFTMPGVCVKDVSQQAFVMAFAAHLKKSGKLKVPAWVDLIKTGVHKELSPYNPDWYYIRCASTLRHLYIRGGVGVKTFQKIYGGASDEEPSLHISVLVLHPSLVKSYNLWKESSLFKRMNLVEVDVELRCSG